jgi:hypothetical protein
MIPAAAAQAAVPLSSWFVDRQDAEAVARLAAHDYATVAVLDYAVADGEAPEVICAYGVSSPIDAGQKVGRGRVKEAARA